MTATTLPKVVLITGCSAGGIGGSLVTEYARQGCIVYASARRLESMDDLAVVGDIRKIRIDVNDLESVQAGVKTIMDAENRIDILVNNAGVLAVGAILDVDMKEIKGAFETNFFSALRLIQTVAPLMAAKTTSSPSEVKGLIVNIGSVNAVVPVPWGGIYASTKAALRNISESLYNELSPIGVRVLLVEPGGIKSNLSHKYVGDAPEYVIPQKSLYKAFLPRIVARIHISQQPGAMPTGEFAKQVVAASLPPPRSLFRSSKWNPQFYLSIGAKSTVFWILSFLPKTWALGFIWNLAGKVKK